MTIAICEDEPVLARALHALAEAYCRERRLGASVRCYGSAEALMRAGGADILLMDIRLPGEDGMALAAQLRREGCESPVIFITAYPQYVFDAFELEAVHYLVKPVDPVKLERALDRAVSRLADGPALALEGGRVPLRDILYGEVLDHAVTVHTVRGPRRWPGTLEELERALDGRFFRCHKSFLINLDQVTGRSPGAAQLPGAEVPVARRRQAELARRLLQAGED